MVGILARCHAAEIDLSETGAALLDRHRRQELHDVLQLADLQLVELFIANGVNRDWHILKILFALLRGNNDDVVIFVSSRILRHCRHGKAERG